MCLFISAHVHKHSIDNWKLKSDRDNIFFSKLELKFLDRFTFITLCPIVIVTMVSLPNDDNSNTDDEARRSTTEDIKEMEELLPSILRAHGVVEAKDGDSINTLDGVHFKGLVCCSFSVVVSVVVAAAVVLYILRFFGMHSLLCFMYGNIYNLCGVSEGVCCTEKCISRLRKRT